MKQFTHQIIVAICFVLLLPVACLAQVDRGSTIGPAPIGASGGHELTAGTGKNITVTQGPGFQTIAVKEENRDVDIILHGDGRIKVDVTRQFGPDEMDTLIRRAPELERHIRAFPRQSGNKSVRLSVGLTTSVEGTDAMDLRAKDLVAFNLYKKYVEEASRIGMGGGVPNGPVRGGVPSKRIIGPAMPGGGQALPGQGLPGNAPDGKKKKAQRGTGIG